MEELESANTVIDQSAERERFAAERERLTNLIIAAGLNSLSLSSQEKDQLLLNSFISQSFVGILPCWPHLSDKIQFHIFKSYITEFQAYMRANPKEGF